MWIGSRGPFSAVVHGSIHGPDGRAGPNRTAVLEWKKGRNHGITVAEPPIDDICQFLMERGGALLDIWTVPPPSFHAITNYPALILAERIGKECGKAISILWPDRYEKAGKVWMANIDKIYPAPSLKIAGQSVLVLDDIATSCNTMAECMRVIVIAGGFPAGIAYA